MANATDNEKLKYALILMVPLGFGEMIGAIFIGQVIDRTSNRVASMVNILLVIL